jgi:hypothetical protein
MISTSGCAPDDADEQSLQVPHPDSLQIKACANATAAVDRPDPGGPVKSQE